MPGNSNRRGAVRKAGTKKGAQVGSGGKGRKALEGKGPTPKAEDRPYHVAHKRKARADKAGGASQQGGRSRGGRSRGGDSTELVVGRNAVLEALRAGMPAQRLTVFERIDNDDRVAEAVQFALDADVTVREVRKSELDAMAEGAVHQGIALEVPPYEYADIDALLAGTPLIAVLDGIQDTRNLGAIMRSAAAFGATGVLIPERRAAGVTVAAWKVSAGAAARLPVVRATNLVRDIERLKQEGIFTLGLAADGDVALGDSPLLDGPLAIVVGAEGKGLSRLVREACDQVASIPIAASTESLNASVAASLALYEASKRR